MSVHVRFFAMHRERIGRKGETLELPRDATIAVAWDRLVRLHPELVSSSDSVRFARNGAYADPADILRDGDELAIVPPVAGGADQGPETSDATRGRRTIALTPHPIEHWDRAIGAGLATPADGAVVTFVGRTRSSPGTPAPGEEAAARRHRGAEVVALEYEAYEEMARAVLEQIADELEQRLGVERLSLVHRTGRVAVGEASVIISVAAPHRAAAFDACRYAIDELKARVPIWKSEQFADGGVWLGAPARSGPP
ncbi:MAG: MoaD family protein [Chloroflexi bacterium]|nr:MoaD family protein [Chloroflexota bacterium]